MIDSGSVAITGAATERPFATQVRFALRQECHGPLHPRDQLFRFLDLLAAGYCKRQDAAVTARAVNWCPGDGDTQDAAGRGEVCNHRSTASATLAMGVDFERASLVTATTACLSSEADAVDGEGG